MNKQWVQACIIMIKTQWLGREEGDNCCCIAWTWPPPKPITITDNLDMVALLTNWGLNIHNICHDHRFIYFALVYVIGLWWTFKNQTSNFFWTSSSLVKGQTWLGEAHLLHLSTKCHNPSGYGCAYIWGHNFSLDSVTRKMMIN